MNALWCHLDINRTSYIDATRSTYRTSVYRHQCGADCRRVRSQNFCWIRGLTADLLLTKSYERGLMRIELVSVALKAMINLDVVIERYYRAVRYTCS